MGIHPQVKARNEKEETGIEAKAWTREDEGTTNSDWTVLE